MSMSHMNSLVNKLKEYGHILTKTDHLRRSTYIVDDAVRLEVLRELYFKCTVSDITVDKIEGVSLIPHGIKTKNEVIHLWDYKKYPLPHLNGLMNGTPTLKLGIDDTKIVEAACQKAAKKKDISDAAYFIGLLLINKQLSDYPTVGSKRIHLANADHVQGIDGRSAVKAEIFTKSILAILKNRSRPRLFLTKDTVSHHYPIDIMHSREWEKISDTLGLSVEFDPFEYCFIINTSTDIIQLERVDIPTDILEKFGLPAQPETKPTTNSPATYSRSPYMSHDAWKTEGISTEEGDTQMFTMVPTVDEEIKAVNHERLLTLINRFKLLVKKYESIRMMLGVDLTGEELNENKRTILSTLLSEISTYGNFELYLMEHDIYLAVASENELLAFGRTPIENGVYPNAVPPDTAFAVKFHYNGFIEKLYLGDIDES